MVSNLTKCQQYNYIYVTVPLNFLLNYLLSINAKNAVLPPFDSAQWGNSNKLYYIFLRPLDAKEFNKMLNDTLM